jgi:hypothetical protein
MMNEGPLGENDEKMMREKARTSGFISDFTRCNALEFIENRARPPTIIARQRAPQIAVSDSQNVHDTALQNGASERLADLEKSNGKYTGSFHLNEARDAMLRRADLTDVQKNNVRRVMTSLGTHEHSRYGRSEQDVMRSVWGRINDPVNKERRDDLILALAQGLDSAVEYDTVVCSTGKIMRMLGSLDVIDAGYDIGSSGSLERSADGPEKQQTTVEGGKNIASAASASAQVGGSTSESNSSSSSSSGRPLTKMVPGWAIDQEIASSAAAFRNRFLESAPEREKEAYEAVSPTEEQREVSERVAKQLQEGFRDKCTKDYVDAGALSKDALDSKLNVYLESF